MIAVAVSGPMPGIAGERREVRLIDVDQYAIMDGSTSGRHHGSTSGAGENVVCQLLVYTKPRLLLLKLPIDGSTVDKLAEETPNHWASVAAYCELAVEGTHRPLEPESSGPASANVG